LNFLADVAHTEVSRLGEILKITFLPESSDRERELRSGLTSLKSGALLAFTGRLPDVLTGLPLNVIFAIIFFSNLILFWKRNR